MYTKRQAKFLLIRFDNDLSKAINYLDDLCSKSSVKQIAKKHNTNPVQVQRDRNNFITRNIMGGLNKTLQNLL